MTPYPMYPIFLGTVVLVVNAIVPFLLCFPVAANAERVCTTIGTVFRFSFTLANDWR